MRNIHAYSGIRLDFILLCTFCLCSDQEKSTKDRGTLLDEWTNKRVDIPCQEAVWSDGVDFPLECNLDLVHLLCDLVQNEIDRMWFHPGEKNSTASSVFKNAVQQFAQLSRWIGKETVPIS